MARKKTKKLKMRQIRNDPQNERWVENMEEFGRAGSANRLFRRAFRPVILDFADRYISGRLTGLMRRILLSDSVNGRGERTIATGDVRMLEHFNFNRDCHLFDVLNIPGHTVTFDRETGQVQLLLPPVQPLAGITMPKDYTHFKIVIAAAVIDFHSQRDIDFARQDTEDILYSVIRTSSMQLTLSLLPGISHPVIIALGVQFFKQNRSGHFDHPEKSYNAMEVIQVEVCENEK